IGDIESAVDNRPPGLLVFETGKRRPAGAVLIEGEWFLFGVAGPFGAVVLDDQMRAPAAGQLLIPVNPIGPGDVGAGAVVAVQGFNRNTIQNELGLKTPHGQGPTR